jgi:RNA polymerase sigma-70 factor (ECF subfamily)
MAGDEDPFRQDLELVQRTRQGDSSAQEEFLERMRSVPKSLALENAKLGRPLGATELEDLVQEVLSLVWRKLADYSGRGAFDAWVYRIGYLELLSRLRKLRRFPALLEDLEKGPSEPAAPDEPDTLEREQIYACLEKLGPREGEVIRLKHFEGLTFEEIAVRLHSSTNTVKTRYYRGLGKLRQALGADFRQSRAEQSS